MASPVDALTQEKNKTQYLNQDRSVNIRNYFDKQDKLKSSGLENIEILDKAKAMGKDDFLKILVTQLSHQDPTAPMKDQEFIAQMAQFSSLEQMQNISSSMNRMADRQALDLVGKFIVGTDSSTGDDVMGEARAIFYDGSGKTFVKVGNAAVDLNQIKVIGNTEDFKTAEQKNDQFSNKKQELQSAAKAYEQNENNSGKESHGFEVKR